MDEKVIIALDFDSAEKVYAFLDRFGERKLFVKIGMELFYAEGPAIVREIKRRGHRIFLDLKLHDIPNTVGKAMRVLSGLDVDLCNLHASGTKEMMEAAVRGLQGDATDAPDSVLACAKHFVGYGAAEGGRDYTHAEISDYALYNY